MADTLTIFGVVTILAISMGRSAAQRSALSSVVNKFVADFSRAKQLASRENRYVAIEFNSSGTSYSIWKQVDLGDLDADFKYVETVVPMEDKEFFDGSTIQHFAVNSVGEVYRYYPSGSTKIDTTQTFGMVLFFYIKRMEDEEAEIDYKRKIRIYPSGGISVEK